MASPQIPRNQVEDIIALTPTQEGMLFYYISQPKSAMYFEQLSLRLKGELDFPAFIKAWQFVIETNEMLRAVFRWDNVEKPVQIILKTLEPDIRQYDFSSVVPEKQTYLLEELRDADRQEMLDLATKPYRLILCKLNPRETEMIISNHHILYDGWSTGIILKELLTAYKFFLDGLTPSTPRKNRFKDYIKWLQWLNREKQQQFWRQYLSEYKMKTLLPYREDFNRIRETITINTHPCLLSPETKADLYAFTYGNNLTPATIFYTAWGITLQLYNFQNDAVFGTTVSGRSTPISGIQDMVGLFINTIPLRVRMGENETFRDVLKRMETDLLNRQEYEALALTDIKKCLDYNQKLSLFDSIVVVENYPLDQSLSGENLPVAVSSYTIFEMTNYDLTLGITLGNEIVINFIYKNDLFLRETIETLGKHFLEVIRIMVTQPESQVKDLHLLTDEERVELQKGYEIQRIMFREPQEDYTYVEPENETEENIHKIWQKVLGIERIGVRDNFFDIGGTSTLLIQVHAKLEKVYPGIVTGTDLFTYATIAKLAKYINEKIHKQHTPELEVIPLPEKYFNPGQITTDPGSTREVADVSGKDIAIIGVAVKLPKTHSIEDFWRLLQEGTDFIDELPATRRPDVTKTLEILGIPTERLEGNRAAFLETVDRFDYNFFNISPKEASWMDPNQRLFLETAWAAIEDAGYGGEKLTGSSTGVYVGFNSDSEYKRLLAQVAPEALGMALPGNVKPIVAGRLSYLLDFHGPNMVVDTTCSSSLTAIHLACQALRNGECSHAIVGGIQLHLVPVRGAKIGVEASDDRAKSFDDSADGTGTGEGVIAMLLKPLWKAQKDRDRVYAVIKGSAVNHDGNSNGLTAPSAAAQEELLLRAWEDAGIAPETIAFIEAHGTGTKLGDPIEVDGLHKAFSRHTGRKQFCAIGSVKTNIGHLDNASGIAGVLKAVLSLYYKKLVPSVHFNRPSARIPFENSPVYVNDRLRNLENNGHPIRCGVSSFGLSGTNGHIVLEEAPVFQEVGGEASPLQVLTISAKNEPVLHRLLTSYTALFRANPGPLPDICYTVNTGRGHYSLRLAILAESPGEMETKLRGLSHTLIQNNRTEGVFYGEHHIVSGYREPDAKEYLSETRLRELSSQANQLMDRFVASGRRDRIILENLCDLYIQGAEVNWAGLYADETHRRVKVPVYPFERHRCWLDYPEKLPTEKQPETTLTGEPLLDRCVVFSPWLEVYATDFRVARHWVLNEHKIDGKCVLVGTTHLEMVMEACRKRFPGGVHFERIQFLTALFVEPDTVAETHLVLQRDLDGFVFYVASHQTLSHDHEPSWVKHVEGKVTELRAKGDNALILEEVKKRCWDDYLNPDMDSYQVLTSFEFGPRWRNIKEIFVGNHELLSYLEIPAAFKGELPGYPLHPSMLDNALTTIPLLNKVLPSLPGKTSDIIYLPFAYHGVKVLKSLPDCFYSYVKIKEAFDAQSEILKFSVVLIDTSGNVIVEIEEYALKKARKTALEQKKTSIHQKNIFFHTNWVLEEESLPSPDQTPGVALVFRDEKGLSPEIEKELKNSGWTTFGVNPGERYAKLGPDSFTVGNTQTDYDLLIREIGSAGITHIFHLSAITMGHQLTCLSDLDQQLNLGLYSLFYLSRALLANGIKGRIRMVLLGENAYAVTGENKRTRPENAALFGLGKVLTREYPNLVVKWIDLDDKTALDTILHEMLIEHGHSQIALRNNLRYVENLTRLISEPPAGEGLTFRENGVYLITGGAGGIGLEICRYMATKARINLAIVGRTPLPEREEWDIWTARNPRDPSSAKIRAFQELEQLGARVCYFSADVASESAMQRVLERLREMFGQIDGIIHSAGVAGDGYIIRKEEKQFQQVLDPKINGTWLLHHLTAMDDLDFFILFSSNNTLMGVPGQGDYTAANSFLDSFTYYRNHLGKRTITINWPAWKETGMAFDHGVNTDGILKAMATREALGAFEKVLQHGWKRVILGELNERLSDDVAIFETLELRISDELRREMTMNGKKEYEGPRAGRASEQVILKGKPQEDYTDVERNIAKIWNEVLGYHEFDVHTGFFEIGGDSIMVTRVYNLIDEQYPGKVQIGDLFTYPTIARIAGLIDNDKRDQTPNHTKSIEKAEKDLEQDIVTLLEEVEKGNLSLEKATEMMEQLTQKK